MADAQRVEIGFEGGQVISARLTDADFKDLRKQLEKGGWHDVHTEDGVLALYLGKVAFLRIESDRPQGRFQPQRLRLRARATLCGAAWPSPRRSPRRLWWRRTLQPAPTASASGSRRRTRSSAGDRLRAVLSRSPESGCLRSARGSVITPSTWPDGSAPPGGLRSSTSSRSSSTTPCGEPPSAAWHNLTPSRGDATPCPTRTASMDAVVLTAVLGEIPDPSAALQRSAASFARRAAWSSASCSATRISSA